MEKREMIEMLVDHYCSGNKAKFAAKIGIKPQALSMWIARNSFDAEVLYTNCEGLSADWLMTGEGEMLVSANSTLQNVNKSTKGTPFYSDLPVSAGRVMQYPTIMQEMPSGSIDIPQAKGVEFFFPVIGMSMRPTIEEGDIIGVCHIDRYETTNADRLYMIVTRDNERMIKRILKYDREAGTITLGSDNPNYPSFDLETDLIVDVYKVVLHLKIETM